MLSGIGEPSTLESVGITTIVNSTDVGRHLQDQPILANYWTVTSNKTLDDLLRNSTMLDDALAQWQIDRTGPLANPPLVSLGFLRLPENSTLLNNITDPSAGEHPKLRLHCLTKV